VGRCRLAVGCYEAYGLLAGALVFGIGSAHSAGHSHAPRFLDAPDRHAQVVGFDHYYGAESSQLVVQRVGDLGGQALLKLGTAGVTLHQPGQLGQPDHLPVRYVANVGLANHRQKVMFTELHRANAGLCP
jgi:hypothetical protein